tara:strand:+ start:520 stop:738 length:219 start_codon:yes stop_codon:yes gene_type:complete
MEYKLSTKSIAQIVQLIQLGMLTGTDVSDQLRTFRLNIDEETSSLVPSKEFTVAYNENLAKLSQKAESMQKD